MIRFDPHYFKSSTTYLLEGARLRAVLAQLNAVPTTLPPASTAFGDIKGLNPLDKKATTIKVGPGEEIAFMNGMARR